jgi:hypothetical protein
VINAPQVNAVVGGGGASNSIKELISKVVHLIIVAIGQYYKKIITYAFNYNYTLLNFNYTFILDLLELDWYM